MRSIDLDPVELVGQLEALDAGGQLGDGFVVAEGVQGEDAGLVFLGVVGAGRPAIAKAMVCTPNWPCRKLAKIMSTSLLRPGTNSAAWDRFQRQRSPSLLAASKDLGSM